MEELSNQVRFTDSQKKMAAIVIILLVILPLSTYGIILGYRISTGNNPYEDPYAEISHSLTVWIASGDEEFSLHLDFYGSEQDLYSETNRFSGLGIRVEPSDPEENQIYLYTIPDNLVIVWVKIYFDQETQEPNVILDIELSRKITTDLQGHEISILLQHYDGE